MEEVVVVGGSFSGLKLISLLSLLNENCLNKFKITLIANNLDFIFLPLLSDYLLKRNKSIINIETCLANFCSERKAQFYNSKAINLEKNSKTVFLSNGKKIRYNYLIIATGSTKENEICIQSYWNNLVKNYIINDKELNFQKLGIAEFEISSAAFDKSKNIKINLNISSKHKKFITHPKLSKIKTLEKKLNSLDKNLQYKKICDYYNDLNNNFFLDELFQKTIFTKNGFSKDNNIILIGGTLASQNAIEPSAQFASFSSKCIFLYLSKKLQKKNIPKYSKNLVNKYRSRGDMLFVGKYNALISLNIGKNNFLSNIVLKGPIAYLVRLIFYFLQKNLFYSEKRSFFLINFLYLKIYLPIWYLKKSILF